MGWGCSGPPVSVETRSGGLLPRRGYDDRGSPTTREVNMQTAQLNSYDAARAVGVTYRQLDHWLRIGVVRSTRAARGSGSHRRFSRRDVMLLAAVAELMRLGAGTESAARLWAFLDGLDGGRWPRAVVVTPGSLCVPAAGELPPSGWYVDVAAAVDQAGAALLDTILEKVG